MGIIRVYLDGRKIIREGGEKDLTERLRLVASPKKIIIPSFYGEKFRQDTEKRRISAIREIVTQQKPSGANAYLWDGGFSPHGGSQIEILVQYCALKIE